LEEKNRDSFEGFLTKNKEIQRHVFAPRSPPPPLFQEFKVTGNTALLRWRSPIGGHIIVGYRLYLDGKVIYDGDDTEFKILNLMPGARYEVGIASVDGQAQEGNRQSEFFVTVASEEPGGLWFSIKESSGSVILGLTPHEASDAEPPNPEPHWRSKPER